MARPHGVVQRSRIASFASRLVGMERGHGCHHGEYANVLLAMRMPKDSCVSSALHTQQIATSSVARAVWCGSGVIVDGKTA